MENEKINSSENVVHNFESSQENPFFSGKLLMFIIVVALVGVGTGYFLAKSGTNLNLGTTNISKIGGGSSVSKGTTVGSNDTKTFKDITEGVLKEGGVDGEGQFHLVRPGGDSQNVYLTSSIIDLAKYVNRKIKVWGETQKAQKAGWLMDVGRIEVLE